jgi:Tol biopolymer transport system component
MEEMPMEAKRALGSARVWSHGALLVAVLSMPAASQVTSLVSLKSSGAPMPGDSIDPAISVDGRYVGFVSYPNFAISHVYLRDRVGGKTELVSVDSNEKKGDSYSYAPSLSADVRHVAFSSWSTNLVAGDTNGPYPEGHDVFVRDRQDGTTERVSVDSNGAQANDQSYLFAASISADGRHVVFQSYASNLVAGDTNAAADVFLRDRQSDTTELVSLDSNGAQANGASELAALSTDGRWVAFTSLADNLVAGDTNAVRDVFVRDRQTGTTERVSLATGGTQGDGESFSGAISPDGRYVAFHSSAGNLVAGDSNRAQDVFVRDRLSGTTELVSVDSSGAQGNGSSQSSRITPDGRYVTFQSYASNLMAGDTNGKLDAFLRDRLGGTTERLSVDTSGSQGNGDSRGASISPEGRYAAFASQASLAPQDTNTWYDIYVRDRDYSPMTTLCDPGSSGVIACPCSNPPSGPGRGCDNSSGTGGAMLLASGVAYLSADTLVFTTNGQKPKGLSIVMQGTAPLFPAVVFGQGVSCLGGSFERLYTKVASGGSIVAPDMSAGDPAVSARSAILGDPIQAGQSRWYVVYYRDPIVLGSCPLSSSFNATQTGEVVWLP